MRPVLTFRHVEHESMGTLERIFRDAGLVYSYVNLYQEQPRAFDPNQLAGLVVLGGPMNADETDRYPFLAPEIGWIQSAIECGLPVLGICLGSQLVAKALGSKVYANRVKEIGWYDVETTPAAADDPLFADFGPRQTVFQWHGDTFDLPSGAVQLARNDQCEQQAFRYGSSVYGLQFHAEVTAEMIRAWFAEPASCVEVAALDYVDPDAVQAEIPHQLPAMHALGDRLFSQFATQCRNRADEN